MFDLSKYLGLWYEIARTPNFFQEDGSKNITAEYKLNCAGVIDVVNTETKKNGKIHKIKGSASIINNPKKPFFSAIINFENIPYPGDYNVIGIDKNYTLAVIYSFNTKVLWILSRTKKVNEQKLKNTLQNLINYGYSNEVKKLIYNIQE